MDAPIILATDLTARSDRAFARAVQLAGQWKCRLVVVHVLEEIAANSSSAARAGAEKALSDLTEGLVISHETLVENGSPPEAIAGLAKRLGAAAIVVADNRLGR